METTIPADQFNPFHRFFCESSSALLLLDEQGFILAANENGERTLELLTGSAGKEENLTEILARCKCASFGYHFSRLIALAARSVNFDSEISRSAGEKRLINFRCSLIERLEDAPPHWRGPFVSCILEDTTEQRHTAESLMRAKEDAERSTETKSQFLANMSHEIRTPIQTIIGMTELLQDTELTREQREYSRQMRFSAEVLLSLVNDILDYSKIEANRLDLEKIDVDPEKTIEQAVDLVSLEAHKKGLEMTLDLSGELPKLIRADQVRLRQIIVNLAKNAVKFTREGGIVVTARKATFDGKEAIAIGVSDSGIGVAPELRPLLFTTFFQGDTSTTRRFGGTGLGLAISRHLVQIMGGEIGMRANEGGGSTFHFTIPIERSEFDSPREQPCIDSQDRVLVVDDREESRRVITSYLAGFGYTHIEESATGEAALGLMRQAAAAGRPFELCLIDMVMPMMDGWRLAAEINQDHLINSARLILMVPQGSLGADAKMTLLQWFNAYVNKPIKRDELAEAISCAAKEGLDLEEAKANREDGEEGAPQRAFHASVLVTEDHPVNQRLFALILERLSCEVQLAADGLEAVEMADKGHFDLIFMDIQMPRLNGYEATERIREQGYTGPIIAITASALSDEKERCLAVGMNDILVKPFRRPEIEKCLSKWISNEDVLEEVEAVEEVAPDNAVLNTKELVDTFLGNEATVRSLLGRYLARTEQEIASMGALIRDKNWERLRLEAHTIKGSALNLSAKELAKAALDSEMAAKDEREAESAAALAELGKAFERFKRQAGAWLHNGAA